jgi:aspartate/methionine/tyrosine aminotransferase
LTVPNAVSWSSATKCFGYSSLRAGWIVTRDESLADALHASSHYLHVEYPAATAALATEVLRQAPALRERAESQVRAARRVIDRWIAAEPRVDWIPPSAGLSGLIRLPELMQDVRFAQHLRERYETQVVPGTMFEAPGTVRVSFGLPEGELEQALANFSASLDDLG